MARNERAREQDFIHYFIVAFVHVCCCNYYRVSGCPILEYLEIVKPLFPFHFQNKVAALITSALGQLTSGIYIRYTN